MLTFIMLNIVAVPSSETSVDFTVNIGKTCPLE